MVQFYIMKYVIRSTCGNAANNILLDKKDIGGGMNIRIILAIGEN